MAIPIWPAVKAAANKILAADFNLLLNNAIEMFSNISDGWIDTGETWTYASADSPTFKATISGNKTSKYSVGMKVKLTQTTVKYFFITAISYSSGTGLTTVTLYGGTDYTLTSAAISGVYYSMYKSPYAFPMNPDKWSVLVTDTTQRTQSSPTAGTWYNLGSISIIIPIGLWEISLDATPQTIYGSNIINAFSTLSTANNSESDIDFTIYCAGYGYAVATLKKRKILNLTAKTTYYLNEKTSVSSTTSLDLRSDLSKTNIRALCAYL